MLAGRQKRQYGRHHFRRLVQQRGDRRAALQVVLHRHAIGLHDEHAPVAPVIGRNIRLRRHDVVEARHLVEHAGDAQRLAADIGPALGEALGVGEIMLGVERGRRRDAAVVNGAHNAGGAVVEWHGLLSPDGRPCCEYSPAWGSLANATRKAGYPMTLRKLMLALLLAPLLSAPLRAQEGLVTFKSMSVDLADCQKQGFQVAVAVVDRFGVTQVLLRDRFAGAHTVPTATGKAWTAVSFRSDTSAMIAPTQPGMPQAGGGALPGVTVIAGGVMVEAGGSLIGAVGVSGAPLGTNDEASAKAGIAAIRDKLD